MKKPKNTKPVLLSKDTVKKKVTDNSENFNPAVKFEFITIIFMLRFDVKIMFAPAEVIEEVYMKQSKKGFEDG